MAATTRQRRRAAVPGEMCRYPSLAESGGGRLMAPRSAPIHGGSRRVPCRPRCTAAHEATAMGGSGALDCGDVHRWWCATLAVPATWWNNRRRDPLHQQSTVLHVPCVGVQASIRPTPTRCNGARRTADDHQDELLDMEDSKCWRQSSKNRSSQLLSVSFMTRTQSTGRQANVTFFLATS
ncbi:hypothetical protein EJB05_53104, partial [Eragrostis curvula]